MKFKFDSNLDFQLEAINAIIDIFKGQRKNSKSLPFIAENGVIPNELNIGEKKIFENLKEVQTQNNIKTNEKLEGMDFTIEMETGTGKTYVYLRTILMLNRKYGFQKFIIIVPSVAIREGVLKSLQITKQHFKQLYDNVSYNFYEYDSSKLSRIRQFSRNNNVEIMVMTINSFNKDTNIMNLNIDQLSGQKPIDLVSLTKPILILDEPQNMETEKAQEAMKKLNPLMKLRYSATHKSIFNLVYRLSPIDAYNKNLVKKIEVLSVVKDEDFNAALIRCLDIIADAKGIKAKLQVFKKQKTGQKLASITVRGGDDLYEKTKSEDYKDIKITKIDARYGLVEFSNGATVNKGQELGGDRQELMRTQIQQTIEEHFRKQARLKEENIKVLSLFFIDRVANYTEEDGFIRKTFIEEFNKIKKKFPNYKNLDVNTVHNGYFSNYKSESGMERDKEAFDLIMKDKERLLSFDEPTSFIFSHSALREGWDNPNVFNICTLNETVSEMKKRQEIGRGVRLPVNQDGDRINGLDFNILTVVANESYAGYVSKLQQEYVDEYGIMVAPPKPANARNRRALKLKKDFKLTPEFKELWKKISKKTKYAVNVDTKTLVDECVKQINEISIDKIRIKIEKVSLSLNEKGIQTEFVGDESEELDKEYPIPNLIEHISQETNLTRNTVYEILSKIKNMYFIFKNPKEFIQSITLIIKEKLKDFLINGVKYLELQDVWKMELFEDNLESYKEYVINVNKSIYDGVVWDSEGEKTFAEKLEGDNRVKLFIKLPRWFVVNTPIGKYNPDWAVVLEERDVSGKARKKLYLVRETKFVDDMGNIRPSEKQKIKCAEEHFKTINVDYKPIKAYEELV
ncbi:MAG TPA: DEAD/DEAH box helicase [Euryarchaeota archaeon]|nr:type III restriction enzyme, res subunit [archaeon BMS3Bbin15]HDL15994.1 DEAD/DEAH box helicase [Euryarchaeota archaeon]